jgi:Sulfotransferase family
MIRTDDIISAARQATHIDDPIDDRTLENLSRYVTALNREARLSEAGKVGIQGTLVGALRNRLRVERYAKEHPELLERPIERPMFVFGFPRTGTTLAVNLLNQDPARRGFLRWQAEDPIPPAKSGAMRTDPRCLAKQAQLEEEAKLMPHIAAIHYEDADSVTECQLSMCHTFCTHMFEAVTEVPSWRAWFLDTSYLPTFHYHKRLLQVMQSETPGRWLLKNPWHALFLKDLTTVYPDARYVMAHRDPVEVVASYCSLVKTFRGLYSDDVDLKNIADTTLDIFDRMARGALAHKQVHGAACIYDLHYGALLRNPIGEMKKLYRHFDEPWTEAAERNMKKFLAKNPQGRHGRHAYSLQEFGLSPELVRARFADYCRQFNVEQTT